MNDFFEGAVAYVTMLNVHTHIVHRQVFMLKTDENFRLKSHASVYFGFDLFSHLRKCVVFICCSNMHCSPVLHKPMCFD